MTMIFTYFPNFLLQAPAAHLHGLAAPPCCCEMSSYSRARVLEGSRLWLPPPIGALHSGLKENLVLANTTIVPIRELTIG